MGGGPLSSLVNVAPAIDSFTALRHLGLMLHTGITPATVGALSSLQQLVNLSTHLAPPMIGQGPADLAEYAHLTGAPSSLLTP